MQQIDQRAAAFYGYTDCFLLTDRTGRIFDANRSAVEITGYSPEEIVTHCLSDIFTRPVEATRMPSTTHPLTEERVLVVYMIPKTGPIDAQEGTLRLIPIQAQGKEYAVCGWQSTVSTATHEALLIERHRYRSLFDQAHDAVFILDLEGNHMEVNQRTAELLGYTTDEINSLSSRGISADPDDTTKVLGRLLAGETIAPYERVFRRKDGSTVDVEVNVELVRDGHGKPVHIQSMVRDITERKKDIARIKRLADQRELLLREVHHRVKNSMATVISMIELEADGIADPDAKVAMEGVSRRVRSMQVVYDSLFLSEDHSTVQLDEYLSALAESLRDSFSHVDGVTIKTDLVPLEIPAKMTFAVGIVVNELVTNAFKYAFPDGRSGTVTVELSEVGDDMVRLAVTDDGVGHADEDVQETGFGTLMIESLVEQIRGKISRKTTNGTVVELMADRTAFSS